MLSVTDRAASLLNLDRGSSDFRSQLDSYLAKIGIRTLDSQNDLTKIKNYLKDNPLNPRDNTTPETTTPGLDDPSTNPEVNTDSKYDDLLAQLKSDKEQYAKDLQDSRDAAAADLQKMQDANKSFLDQMRIDNQTRFDAQTAAMNTAAEAARERETGFQTQLTAMNQQRIQAEQDFQRQYQTQQQEFETAQRTSASNMARGGQQTDYRLGPAANALRGGTAGFQRRPKSTMPAIGAAGFSAPVPGKGSAKTLNV